MKTKSMGSPSGDDCFLGHECSCASVLLCTKVLFHMSKFFAPEEQDVYSPELLSYPAP